MNARNRNNIYDELECTLNDVAENGGPDGLDRCKAAVCLCIVDCTGRAALGRVSYIGNLPEC